MIILAHFPWRPEVSFSNILQSPAELLLQLRWIAKLKQGLDGLVIKEVDLLHCFLLQESLHNAPHEGKRSRDADNIADEHSGSVGI